MFAAILSKLVQLVSGKTKSAAEPVRIVVYTRKGCHLCDLASDQLQKAGQRYALVLEEVDVDSDADLRARFGEAVPVVCVDGDVRFWGHVNDILLTRLLDAKARGRAQASL